MVEQQRTCIHLLLLVGSNPFPNYLAALIYRPQSIRLFYSPETEEVKNYLRKGLETKLAGLSLDEKCIEDATSAPRVREAFSTVPDGAHLHYTGGTKIMAAHARMAFRDAGGGNEHASYLDERRGVLRFDDGYEIELSRQSFQLGLDEVLGLHGIKRIPKNEQFDSPPTEQDAGEIATAVLGKPELAGTLYKIRDDNGKPRTFQNAKQNPVVLSGLLNTDLSISRIPEDNWTKETYEGWRDFLGGGWLEVWCNKLVHGILGGSEVSVGVDCKRANNREFEIDLAIVRGHRLYVISCTTDATIRGCKPKLFEVAMRARQLGGDLTRSALVCLLNGSNPKGPYVDQLRDDVTDIWGAPNTPQVFGLDDLREWAGIGGEPNTGSLKQWLDT